MFAFDVATGQTREVLTLSGKLYVVERGSGKVTQLNAGAGVIDPRFSPDGKQVAYVRDNVFFSHTLKLSDALFRAGKPHELLPLSGSTHMVADPAVSERLWARLMRHFQENL